jgi:membrane protein implicated in regulation of membrane protease activity
MDLSWLENLSPWTWLVLGLALILFDLLVVPTFYLIWVGAAVMLNGLWSFLGLSIEIQLLLVSSTCLLSAYGARVWLGHDQGRLSLLPKAESLIGKSGTVLVVLEADHACGIGAVQGHGEWRISSPNGELRVGAPFTVVGTNGTRLTVHSPNLSIN